MREFKLFCLLPNDEVKSCYPYDYTKKDYDYSKPLVRKYGDNYVYVEEITTREGIKGESLTIIKKFFDDISEL